MDVVHAAISDERSRGALGLAEAVEISRAIAKGNIEQASGVAGMEQLRAFSTCALEVDDALEQRAAKGDALAPIAAMIRVESGSVSASRFARWATASAAEPGAAWRPLGARALSNQKDGELRRKLIADGDEDVRRAALYAAQDAQDVADTEAVLEAARLDPSDALRALAIRVAGLLGGDRVVLALHDLFAQANDSIREATVHAWASPKAYETGGCRELERVLATARGTPPVLAALELLAAHDAADGEAVGILERAVRAGPTAERVRAIQRVPLHVASLSEAVAAAVTDPDEAVACAALVRRFEAPKTAGGCRDESEHEALLQRLLAVVDNGGPLAARATGALARAHVQRLVPRLESNAASSDSELRAEAGAAFAVMGDLRRAVLVAADPDPRVRGAVSCAVLRAWAAK
jgi:hypothetical protein